MIILGGKSHDSSSLAPATPMGDLDEAWTPCLWSGLALAAAVAF